MEFIGKELIWVSELSKKSKEALQLEIITLENEAHICELQAFCTKLFLRLGEVEQENNKLQENFNSLEIECNILRKTLREKSDKVLFC